MGRLAARVRRLEELVSGPPQFLLTEEGVRIPLAPYELFDCWLAVIAPPAEAAPLPVERHVLWALATAVVPDGDHGLALMKAAARAELTAEAGA